MAHDPEDSAGAQLAMLVALKLLLSAYSGNSEAKNALDNELERMRADLLGTASSERKLLAFNETAEALVKVFEK